MEKDFDAWHEQKKETNLQEEDILFYEREVWWVRLGVNIGVEIDGKHELFLRPVIILRKFNKHMAFVVPTTTQNKKDKYYVDVSEETGKVHRACLSQLRTISAKRLERKIGTIKIEDGARLTRVISHMILRGL